MDYQKLSQQVIGASGWSQETLVSKLGVSFATLNSWTNGRSKPQRGVNKQAVATGAAEVLGADSVDAAELLGLKAEAMRYKLTTKKLVANQDLLEQMLASEIITVGKTL